MYEKKKTKKRNQKKLKKSKKYMYEKNTYLKDMMVFQGGRNVRIWGTIVLQLQVSVYYIKMVQVSNGRGRKLLEFLLFEQLPLTNCERSSTPQTVKK